MLLFCSSTREAPAATITKFNGLCEKYTEAFVSRKYKQTLGKALRDPEVGLRWVWAADPRSAPTDEIGMEQAFALNWQAYE